MIDRPSGKATGKDSGGFWRGFAFPDLWKEAISAALRFQLTFVIQIIAQVILVIEELLFVLDFLLERAFFNHFTKIQVF